MVTHDSHSYSEPFPHWQCKGELKVSVNDCLGGLILSYANVLFCCSGIFPFKMMSVKELLVQMRIKPLAQANAELGLLTLFIKEF